MWKWAKGRAPSQLVYCRPRNKSCAAHPRAERGVEAAEFRGHCECVEFDPELTWDNWASVVPSKALIFRPYNVFAVDLFESANGEMTPSHLLKMLDKRVVHGSAA